MKINRGELERIYNATRKDSAPVQPEKDSTCTPGAGRDSLVLSNEGRQRAGIGGAVARAAQQIAQPASAQRLLRLKNEVADGSYKVSGEDIAAAMRGHVRRSGSDTE